MRSRGSALLIALMVLALLSVFAISMMTLVRLEVRASKNWVDGRRATLCAEAGVHRAAAELASTFEQPLATTLPTWACLDAQGDYAHGVPIEQCGRISFQETAPRVLESGTLLLVSGTLGSTLAKNGDVYSLKVLDATTQIDLNDERPQLAAQLDNLGKAIALQRGRDPVNGRGQAILDLRSRLKQFGSKREIIQVVGLDDYALLVDFVTTDGWVDAAARRALAPSERSPTEDLSVPRFVFEKRCPININAAPKAMLVALLAGVGTKTGEPLAFDAAVKIADEMLRRRKSTDPLEGPFRELNELADFFASLASSRRIPNFSDEQAEALVANLDPNLRIPDLNPETAARQRVTKADLDHRTSEATFLSHGIFEVTSVGRVLSADGVVVAETKLVAVVRAYNVLRHTTQLDFEGAAVGEPATSRNAASFPNPTRRLGGFSSSIDDGYIQLCDPEVQCGADLLTSRVFEAPYTKALEPISMLPAEGARLEDVPATAGGDLNPDGTRTTVLRKNLFYGQAPPIEAGTIDCWLKVDDDGSSVTGSVVQAVNVLSNDCVLVTDLTATSDGTRLTLEMKRKVFYSGTTTIVPGNTQESRVRATLDELGTFGEWHHVRIAWRQYGEAELYVDGELMRPSVHLPFERAADGSLLPGSWPPPCMPVLDSIVVGGHDGATSAAWRKMTVDDVVVRDGSGGATTFLATFEPPERYPAENAEWVGRFTGCFGPFEGEVEFGTIYWTERRPRKWGRVNFTADDFSFDAIAGDKKKVVEIEVPRPGKKGKHEDHDKDKDGKDDEDGAEVSVGGINVNVGGSGSSGSGSSGSGSSGGSSGSGSGSSGGSSSSGSLPALWLRPELEVLHGPAPPGAKTINYEIRFHFRREGLIARGIVVPPNNASAALDDVTLVYRTQTKILRSEIVDE